MIVKDLRMGKRTFQHQQFLSLCYYGICQLQLRPIFDSLDQFFMTDDRISAQGANIIHNTAHSETQSDFWQNLQIVVDAYD